MKPRQVIAIKDHRGQNEQPEKRFGEQRYIFWQSYINNLVGELLTITDAVFTDTTQRKAVKDLVKNSVWKWANESTYCERCQNMALLKCSEGCPVEPHDHFCPDCNCYKHSEIN